VLSEHVHSIINLDPEFDCRDVRIIIVRYVEGPYSW
jgi:hypothetical protein